MFQRSQPTPRSRRSRLDPETDYSTSHKADTSLPLYVANPDAFPIFPSVPTPLPHPLHRPLRDRIPPIRPLPQPIPDLKPHLPIAAPHDQKQPQALHDLIQHAICEQAVGRDVLDAELDAEAQLREDLAAVGVERVDRVAAVGVEVDLDGAFREVD